ncbi:MAG: ABC transporter permease [Candidatus ainarchaeum sp.]|nr:ABC transporter permease [Candidatus ainarchaeum sp.]
MNQELAAIYFIWKRELIRFFRSKSRVIGSLGMPFFFLAIVGNGLNNVVDLPNLQSGYMGFIVPGILGMVLLSGSLFSGIIVIMDRQFGFLKETLIAPVSRLSIVLGKALGGATTAVFQGILMLFVAMLLGVNIEPVVLPSVIALMFLISLAFVSLGTAFASAMEDMHGFQLIMNFLIMPMFFLSGALFPLDSAPEIIRSISYLNPLTYGVESLRFFLVGYSVIPIELSLGILTLFLIITLFLSVYLFNKIEE